MKKKFRYRKVTPKIENVIKQLRKKGWTLKEISESLNISTSTITYHLYEEERKRVIKKSTFYNKKNNYKQKSNERKKYQRDYQKERYTNDPKFRKKFIKQVAECHKRRRNLRAQQELCIYCGGERKNNEYLSCEKCRRNKR